MTEFKTALEWAAEGRIVKSKVRAKRWLIGEGVKKALYTEAQTVARTDLTEVAATDLPGSVPKAVKYRYDGETLFIWVGSRKDLIDQLKQRKFRYNPRIGRWWRKASPIQVERALNWIRSKGYTLVEET